MLWSPEGPRWNDLENACRGPIEYDLAGIAWRDDEGTEAALAAYGEHSAERLELARPTSRSSSPRGRSTSPGGIPPPNRPPTSDSVGSAGGSEKGTSRVARGIPALLVGHLTCYGDTGSATHGTMRIRAGHGAAPVNE